jgi:hypothetical protein
MATNFPNQIDTFINPVSSNPLSSPPHAQQHANANDAILAIQETLGINPQGGSATVRERIEDVETAAMGGQLGGNFPNPDVRGIRETGGPTLLTIGAVADGQFLVRSGTDIVGAASHTTGSGTFLVTTGFDRVLSPTESNVQLAFDRLDDAILVNDVSGNVALSTTALQSITIGTNNTAIGQSALNANTLGGSNTAVGSQALRDNTSGVGNVVIGALAAQGTTVLNRSVVIGSGVAFNLEANSEDNVIIGRGALPGGGGSPVTGAVVIGAEAGGGDPLTNTSPAGAVFVGFRAGYTEPGDNNTAVGYEALRQAGLAATGNTCVGFRSLALTTSGFNNTGVGRNSLEANSTGVANTAIGANAMSNNTVGQGNVAVGVNALTNNTSGEACVAVGNAALFSSSTGEDNVAVGGGAGQSITTGTQNTCIGSLSGVPATATNSTALGRGASCSVSNQIRLGNASITNLTCQVGLTIVSDERDKADIQDLPNASAIVSDLRPVIFKLNPRGRYGEGEEQDGSKKDEHYTPGFIAQELQVVQQVHEAAWMNLVAGHDPENLGVTHERVIPLLVKALQEVMAKNQELEDRIVSLEGG